MEDPKKLVSELLSLGVVTVTSLAEQSGISRTTISNWLSGRSTISPDSLRDVLTAAVAARDEVRGIMAGQHPSTESIIAKLAMISENYRRMFPAQPGQAEILFIESMELRGYPRDLILEAAEKTWRPEEKESNYGIRTESEGDQEEIVRQPVETGGHGEGDALDSEGV